MVGVGKLTVLKYLMLICNALADKDKLYPQFIVIRTGRRLKNIIRYFHRKTKLPQICGVIDGSHVKLYMKPPQNILRQIIGVDTMYIQYCYKESVIAIEIFWMFVF